MLYFNMAIGIPGNQRVKHVVTAFTLSNRLVFNLAEHSTIILLPKPPMADDESDFNC